jgi:cobalt/nickel transport system permease protein
VSGAHGPAVDPATPLDGPLERLAPETKLVGAVAFLVAAVATPPGAWWAWALDAAVAAALAVVALVPARVLARRLLFEAPFVALAGALVVAGTGPRVAVAGITLSEPGLHAAWAMLSRATLGVVVASVLAATTTPAELLTGLVRLRAPALLCALAEMAVRYLAVLRAELDRIRLAQQLRSPDGRRLRPAAVAGVGAALLVRAYERGERVHLARAARTIGPAATPTRTATTTAAPGGAGAPAPPRAWLVALLPALVAAAAATAAHLGPA